MVEHLLSVWGRRGWISLFIVGLGFFLGFFWAPVDAYQGPIYRMLYLHVPLILSAYTAFFVVFAASVLYLMKGDNRMDFLAHSAAEIGWMFTGLTLLTGSLWGRPVWGVWWVWDARLTLTFILFLIYAGYLLLRSVMQEDPRAGKFSAVLGIIGFLEIPIIHFSVLLWRTLHQRPTILEPGFGRGNIDPSMKWALLVNILGYLLLCAYLVALRFTLEKTKDTMQSEQAT